MTNIRIYYFIANNKLQKGIADTNNYEANYLSYYNDGLISDARGEISLAKYYYNKALDYVRIHEFPVKYEIQQLLELGKINIRSDSVDKGVEFLRRAESMADSIESPNMLLTVYRQMEEAMNARGDTMASKMYRAKSEKLNDQLIDKVRFNAAKNSLYEYEEERNGLRISGMQQKIANYIIGISSITVLLFVVGFFMVITVRNNRKLRSAQVALIEKMNELTQQGEKNAILRERYLNAVEHVDEKKE